MPSYRLFGSREGRSGVEVALYRSLASGVSAQASLPLLSCFLLWKRYAVACSPPRIYSLTMQHLKDFWRTTEEQILLCSILKGASEYHEELSEFL